MAAAEIQRIQHLDVEYEVVESLAVVYYNLYFIFLLHGNGISRLCTNSSYAVMREPQCLAPGEYFVRMVL